MTPSLKRVVTAKPTCLKTPSMRRLVGSTWALKPGDARLPGGGGEVLQQHGGHAPAGVEVVGEEGDLGHGLGRVAVVAGDADHLVVDEADEGHAVDAVDARQPLDVRWRSAGAGG